MAASTESNGSELVSGVLVSPADAMLRNAIAQTLMVDPGDRMPCFEALLEEIESFMATQLDARPWTCKNYWGTDGSRIFRGGVGHSLVIDRAGRVWRGRSYEDFDTTFRQVGNIYEIASLSPIYEQMREYRMTDAFISATSGNKTKRDDLRDR